MMTKKEARRALRAARRALGALLTMHLDTMPPKKEIPKNHLRHIKMRAWKVGEIQAELRLLEIFLRDDISNVEALFRKGG